MTLLSTLRNLQNDAIGGGGLDSAQVTTIAEGATMTVYDSLSLLPISDLTAGTQAFVKSNRRLYISNGSGWYNVQLINLSPRFDSDINSTFSIVDSATPLIITNPASDSDNPAAIITYGGTMSDSGQYLVALTQDSSVWTFTPLSADSVYDNVTLGNLTDSDGGDFTYTFTASDGINQASKEITITYSGLAPAVDIFISKPETSLLLHADTTYNTTLEYYNASNSATGFTENGGIQQGTFTPYRDGGYSFYHVSDAYLTASLSNTIGTGDYTVEAWIYQTIDTNNQMFFSSSGFSLGRGASGKVRHYHGNGGSYLLDTSANWPGTNEWVHIAAVRSSGTVKIYVNGVADSNTGSWSASSVANHSTAYVGRYYGSNVAHWDGYIRELRVANSAIYTSNFTPAKLTTGVTNLTFFTANAPYLGWINSSSTSPNLFGYNGTVRTVPFGPHDQDDHDASTEGGSAYFDGTDDFLQAGNSSDWTMGTGDWCVEGWVYMMRYRGGAAGGPDLWTSAGDNTNTGLHIQLGENVNSLRLLSNASGSWANNLTVDAGEGVPLYAWHHVCISRNGGTIRIFSNGNLVKSGTGFSSYNFSGNKSVIGKFDDTGTNYFMKGYIADLRVVKGSAVRTSGFIPPTSPLDHVTNTKLLMNMTGNSAGIYDKAAGGSVIHTGAQYNTSTRKFTGSSSIYFDGVSDYLQIPATPANQSFYGDFTIEGWVYCTDNDNNTYSTIFSNYSTYNNPASVWIGVGSAQSGKVTCAINGTTGAIISDSALTENTWVHLALVKNGSTCTLYVDGVAQTDTQSSTSAMIGNGDFVHFGSSGDGLTSYEYKGYIQNWRITNGTANYTANFTPPTAEFDL